MAQAAPLIRSFNAGEFSPLVEGRPDLARYPASMRRLSNVVAAPQGPALSRSGTAFVAPASDQAKAAALVPFIFNETQSTLLEFSTDRVRFMTTAGLQVYAAVAFTTVTTAPFVIDSATLNGAVGSEIVLSGFPADYNLNGEVAKVTAKVGTVYTLDLAFPSGKASADGSAFLVYSIPCDYTDDQRYSIQYLQSVDVVYLFTDARTRKLSRRGAYDWTLDKVVFTDGPFMPINETTTTLTPSGTGNAVPVMTSDTTPSGATGGGGNRPAVLSGGSLFGRTLTYPLDASAYWYAFEPSAKYWAGNSAQLGSIEYAPASPFVCTGYSITMADDNQDASYLAKDYAPSKFRFEGFNGSVWTTLDQQEEYVLYVSGKSLFFKIVNTIAYSAYRLVITKTVRNGAIEPRIKRFMMTSDAAGTFNLVASATAGINNGAGFLATDVGRLIRLRGSDSTWRSVEITARVNATTVTVKLTGEPLPDLSAIRFWRLGYWSDTTGWPTCGDFFDDRLCLGGSTDAPDLFAMSESQLYESFSQTNEFGEVLDTSAVVARLNARKLSRIQWLRSDERGLLIGTGSTEYVVASASSQAEEITARNIKARESTSRGSARGTPVKVDRQVLYVARSGRTLREYAYNYEADGFKSPSMTQLASHFGVKRFVQMDYAAEPYGIIWVRREDGSLVGFTYNREEDVIGWHRHDLAGGIVESIAVMPAQDQRHDELWVQIAREVNGQTRRYIERMTRLWDFDMTLADAHFVDSAIRYDGAAITEVYGLQHLEGEEVYGLADDKPFGPITVENGMITLPEEAERIIVGLGYDSEGETSRLENGATDGTAFGKTKRMHEMNIGVWASYGGQIGTWQPNELNEETGELGVIRYVDVDYSNEVRGDQVGKPVLLTGEIGPFTPEPGNERRGSVFFRRPKASPLPFNVTYIAPKINTQDGK